MLKDILETIILSRLAFVHCLTSNRFRRLKNYSELHAPLITVVTIRKFCVCPLSLRLSYKRIIIIINVVYSHNTQQLIRRTVFVYYTICMLFILILLTILELSGAHDAPWPPTERSGS